MLIKNNKHLPESVEILIQEFSKFPGVGPKTAERYIFYLLNQSEGYIENLAKQMHKLGKNINLCPQCYNFTNEAGKKCSICQDTSREHKTVCVVAKQQDLMIMENLHEYKGLYHVLQGVLNPVEGISADKLTIKNLILRIRQNNIDEVILALDANIHGESTILYLQKLLKQEKVKVSRLARGMPIGGTLEYADEATLSNALKGRKEV